MTSVVAKTPVVPAEAILVLVSGAAMRELERPRRRGEGDRPRRSDACSCSRRANTSARSSARASGAGGVGAVAMWKSGNCSQAYRRSALDCQPEVPAARGVGQAWRLKPCAPETAGVA